MKKDEIYIAVLQIFRDVFDDEQLAIDWILSTKDLQLSIRDQNHPKLADKKLLL